MKRIKTFSHNIGDQEYKEPVTPTTPYVVDDSSFIPIKEALKQLTHVNNDGSDNSQYYDFPDGKDDGRDIPITRTSSGKDIAELSSDIADKIENISSEVQKVQEFQKFKKETQERMESMRNSNKSTTD